MIELDERVRAAFKEHGGQPGAGYIAHFLPDGSIQLTHAASASSNAISTIRYSLVLVRERGRRRVCCGGGCARAGLSQAELVEQAVAGLIRFLPDEASTSQAPA